MKIERVNIPTVEPRGAANITVQYSLQNADWIWHPDCCDTRNSHVLTFQCAFTIEQPESFRLHLSADQRYELFLDGELISRGPDRTDQWHWSFASYDIELPPGEHQLSALVWWLDDSMPAAQVSVDRGFIVGIEKLAGDATALQQQMNTGAGGWQVAEQKGWSFSGSLQKVYHVIGPGMIIDATEYHAPLEWQAPAVIQTALNDSVSGIVKPKWRLYPSPLPDQLWRQQYVGVMRASLDHNNPCVEADDEQASDLPQWNALLKKQATLVIPAYTRRRLLWDLEEYYCAYPQLSLQAGAEATLEIMWAESLFEPATDDNPPIVKGNRDDIVGKCFYGFGDKIIHDGTTSTYRPFWWRAGRYIYLDIQTQAAPLSITELSLIETRYPLDCDGGFHCSDEKINGIIPLAVRGIQMCSHETFMDCPYYEQLMYVGDTRLEMLVSYMLSDDTALIKRSIELFNWSRWSNGFVAERYPSTPLQMSFTFAMIWVGLLHDFAQWRDDAPWVQQQMVGMRSLLEKMRSLRNDAGLIVAEPGWSFIDWVPGWYAGMHDDQAEGSSIVNLFVAMALRLAAELEEQYGDPYLAQRNRKDFATLAATIVDTFWDDSRELLADNYSHTSFSEHAQCLALLYHVLPEAKVEPVLQGLLSSKDLHRTTIYFSHYLFEVLNTYKHHDIMHEKLAFWKDLADYGFKTPVESPEPSRSDCHAWGSHPLYHLHASIAGVRPQSFGFTNVRIEPQPGTLTEINSTVAHPRGEIVLTLRFAGQAVTGNITLPDGVTGEFVFGKIAKRLVAGLNSI